MKLKAHYYRLTWTTRKGGRTIITRYAGLLNRHQIVKAFPGNPARLTIETIHDKAEIAELSFAYLAQA